MEQTQLHAQVKRMRGGLIVSNLPRSGGNSEDDHEQHNHETVAEAVRARFREAAAKAEARRVAVLPWRPTPKAAAESLAERREGYAQRREENRRAKDEEPPSREEIDLVNTIHREAR